VSYSKFTTCKKAPRRYAAVKIVKHVYLLKLNLHTLYIYQGV